MKQIPGTQGFMASECGVIYDPDGIERNTYKNADGYITASVKLIDGSWVTFGVQRLIALAWIDCPGDPKDYLVNHIDLDIENNHISNLEWVTVEQNNIHAALFSENDGRYKLKAVKGMLVHFATSVSSMSLKTGASPLDIWKSIKDDSRIDGWKYQYLKSGEKPKELHSDKQFAKGVSRDADFYAKKMIWIKDLDTTEVFEYESVTAAAKAHSVPQNHVNFAICREGKPRLFKKSFLVSDTGEFPQMSAEEIEKRKATSGRTVIGYDIQRREFVISNSANKFVQTYGLSKKAITSTLKSNLLKEKGGWLFIYDSPENRERLFEKVKQLTGNVQVKSE